MLRVVVFFTSTIAAMMTSYADLSGTVGEESLVLAPGKCYTSDIGGDRPEHR